MQIDGNCKLLDSARFMRAMKLLKISIAEKSPSLKLVQEKLKLKKAFREWICYKTTIVRLIKRNTTLFFFYNNSYQTYGASVQKISFCFACPLVETNGHHLMLWYFLWFFNCYISFLAIDVIPYYGYRCYKVPWIQFYFRTQKTLAKKMEINCLKLSLPKSSVFLFLTQFVP